MDPSRDLARAASPRDLIHQLLNGYGARRRGELSGPWLVAALRELGHRPAAVRQMLRRMQQTGELRARREGRVNWFRLGELSRSGAASARRKLFGPAPVGWDERWTLALYRFRAAERAEREQVRVILSLESFGSLARGVLLHPHDRVKPVTEALAAAGLADRVRLYRAERAGGPSDRETAAAAWDLPSIAEGFRAFLHRFRGPVPEALSDRECFVTSAAVVRAFLDVSFRDPELPAVLLPADWPGRAAGDRLRALLAGLEGGMLRFGDGLPGA